MSSEVNEAARTPTWPMLVGVAASWFVLDNLTPWLPRGSMPRFGLVVLAVSLMFIAVMVSGAVVRAIYAKVYPGTRRVATPVVRAACIAALWVPAWVLFVETWSLLMIAAGAICFACLGVFLKRCEMEALPDDHVSPPHQPGTPFLFEAKPIARMLLPSFVLVLLLDAVIGLAAARWFVAASVLAAAFAGVLGWRAVMRSRPGMGLQEILPGRQQGAIVAAAFVFTVMALLPYLRVSPLAGFNGVIGKEPKKDSAAANSSSSNEGYVGVILLPLSEQQKKIVAPVKREFVPHWGVKIAKPLEIPFDGQYWYFKWPDKKPRPSARMVRGSSTKTQVSSSDRYPLLMEAHQKLPEAMDLGCCSAMSLVVENADQLSGAISLELWVKKLPEPKPVVKLKGDFLPPGQAPHYLGTLVVPSSDLPIGQRPNASGKPMEETLRFPIPAAMDGLLFDEITVVVKTAPERARMGAKIAIRRFVLEP